MRYFAVALVFLISFVSVDSLIRFTKLLCKSTHTITVYEKCLIQRVGTTSTITIQQKILEPIYSVYANISIIQTSNRLNRVLYKFDNIDVCAFILNRRNPVLRLLYSRFEKFTNLNHSCPFKDYMIVNNFSINDVDVARVPYISGEYGLLTSWKLNGINAAKVDLYLMYN